MSKVKLNPFVDLGLSSDIQSSNLGSLKQLDTPLNNSTSGKSGSLTPNFGGIPDLSKLTYDQTEPFSDLQKSADSNFDSNLLINSAYFPQEDDIKVFQSEGNYSEKTMTVVTIVLFILFLILLGIVAYLTLKYFSVI